MLSLNGSNAEKTRHGLMIKKKCNLHNNNQASVVIVAYVVMRMTSK